MNKFYKSGLIAFAFAILAMLWSASPVQAQDEPGDISEGNDYWFAIPNCKTAVGEIVRWGDSPILIWVASKYSCSFTISSEDQVTVPTMTYDIAPGVVKELNLGADVMLTDIDNENTSVWKGIHINSTQPVTVGVFIAYKWSGEAFRVIPAEWLDNEYYTVNLWQDKVKMYGGSEPELKPGEIVIVASSDGVTNIEYTPKVATPKVAKGVTKQISLRRGQTYLIQAKTSDALSWNTERSDLSGTYIKGDKPFAVLSGHTKGAYPQYPATMYNIKTDFIRNMLMEMIWPTFHLAKEYISAPLKYNDRPFGNAVANERGDLIRFVAVESNTVVKEGKYNPTTKKMEYLAISGIMKAGDFFDIPNRETPGYYVSNKKVLVAQIGKAWIDHLPPPKVGTGDDGKAGDGEIQNPSKNGQGMMLILAPIEKWCSYATFKLISGMNGNFAYFTFKMADQDKLFFDEQKFSTRFGNAVTAIAGTPYAYVVQAVAPGDHTVYGTGGASFAGYCYGNYDACKDGFAYGYPIGMNFATICADTLIAKDTTICDSIPGNCKLYYKGTGDSSCLGFWKVILREADTMNVEFHELTPITEKLKEYKFYFKVRDMKLPATAKLEFKTKSGRKLIREYSYTPQLVGFDQEDMYFGTLNPGDKDSCATFKVVNNGTTPLVVQDMKQLVKDGNFILEMQASDFPFTLAAGASRDFRVCARPQALVNDTIRDTIRVFHQCYAVDLPLKVTTGEPVLYIEDWNFGSVRINTTSQPHALRMENQSNYTVKITNFQDMYNNTGVFNYTATLPIEIPPHGTNESVIVTFTPTAAITYTDSAWVACNASKIKLYSLWNGIGVDAGTDLTSFDWEKRRVVDSYVTGPDFDAAKGKYSATLHITATGTEPTQLTKIEITEDPDGAFEVGAIPTRINAGDDISVQVWYKPLAEKQYSSTITLYSNYRGENRTNVATLKGWGVLPHVNTTGIAFGSIKVDTDKELTAAITHERHPDLDDGAAIQKFDTTLRVYRVYIDGPDATSFSILNPGELTGNLVNYEGSNFQFVPQIKFSPKRIGTFNAMLRVECDAPAANTDKKIDINYAELTGQAFSIGYDAAGCSFPTIFRYQIETVDKNTGKPAFVTFRNLGSSPLTLTKNVSWSDQNNDCDHFSADWTKPELKIGYVLEPSESIVIPVTFKPTAAGSFKTTVYFEALDNENNTVNLSADVEGTARYMTTKVLAAVNDKDNITPGEKRTVDIALYPTDGQTLKDANIRKFTVKIAYMPDMANQTSFIAKPIIGMSSDIITTGTMTEGWDYEIVKTIGRSDSVFAVTFTQPVDGKPLATLANPVLFKFNIQTYYAPMKTASYAPEVTYQQYMAGDNFPVAMYVDKSAESGPFSIKKVCTDDLREIVVGAVANLGEVNPNPAGSRVRFDYTVSFDNTQTSIVLYNSVGDEIVSIVDGAKEAGVHAVELDVDALGIPNGTYYYRMISGDRKSVV